MYDDIMLKGLCGFDVGTKSYKLLLIMWVMGFGTLLMGVHMPIDPMLVLPFVDYGSDRFEIGNGMRSLDDKSRTSSPNWVEIGPRGLTLVGLPPPPPSWHE